MTKLLIESTHSNLHLFCHIFWREAEDILRNLRDGKAKSCPVSCWVWESKSKKKRMIARKNKTREIRHADIKPDEPPQACGRLWVIQGSHTWTWNCMARKGREADNWTFPRFSEQPPQSNQTPWIGHHRFGFGFSAAPATYHYFLICTLDPRLLFSTFSFLGESCDCSLDYSQKIASFLLSESLYRVG